MVNAGKRHPVEQQQQLQVLGMKGLISRFVMIDGWRDADTRSHVTC